MHDSESNLTAPPNSQSEALQTATSDVSLAQRIWARYGNSPGMISSQPSEGRFERIQRWSNARLPLLANLQQRHTTVGSARFPTEPTPEYRWAPVHTHETRVSRSAVTNKNPESAPEIPSNQSAHVAPIMPVSISSPVGIASKLIQRQVAESGTVQEPLSPEIDSTIKPLLQFQPALSTQSMIEIGPAIRRHRRGGVSEQVSHVQESLAEMAGEQPSLTLDSGRSWGDASSEETLPHPRETPLVGRQKAASPALAKQNPVIQRQIILPKSNSAGESGQFPYFRKEAQQLPLVKANRFSEHNENVQIIQTQRLRLPTPPISPTASRHDSPIIQTETDEEPLDNTVNHPPAGETPINAGLSSAPEINLDEITDKILKKIMRYLAVENERKGRFR